MSRGEREKEARKRGLKSRSNIFVKLPLKNFGKEGGNRNRGGKKIGEAWKRGGEKDPQILSATFGQIWGCYEQRKKDEKRKNQKRRKNRGIQGETWEQRVPPQGSQSPLKKAPKKKIGLSHRDKKTRKGSHSRKEKKSDKANAKRGQPCWEVGHRHFPPKRGGQPRGGVTKNNGQISPQKGASFHFNDCQLQGWKKGRMKRGGEGPGKEKGKGGN